MSEAEKKNRRGRRRAGEQTPQGAEAVENYDGEELDDEERGLTAKKGYATTGRRAGDDEETRKGFIGRARDYLKGVRSELDKVTWPTRPDIVRLARIVLAATIAASILLGLISFGFTELFVLGLQDPIWFAGFAFVVVVLYFAYQRWNRNRETTTTLTTRF